MTYFGFLLRFLVFPIMVLLGILWWDHQRGRKGNHTLHNWPAWAAILLHVIIALIYTTPWDNYLVATNVWWYDPELVTGIVIGWVPIEEYTFFLLQPILAGLWVFFLRNRMTIEEDPGSTQSRRNWVIGLGLIWLIVAAILLFRWRPGTYLALELIWALPPIMLQFGFGADILWKYRRLLLFAVAPMTLYLSGADTLAISHGTWTIDPAQSLPILLGGILPVEEFLFFFLTNTLCIFGITLLMAVESRERFVRFRERFRKSISTRKRYSAAD